jgi:hypothetical protein
MCLVALVSLLRSYMPPTSRRTAPRLQAAHRPECEDKSLYIYYHATVPEVGDHWEYAGGAVRWPAGYYKIDTPTGAISENGDPVKWHGGICSG